MGSDWAPAVFLSILALTTGGVILLRPVMRRLGELLEVLVQERRQALEARTEVQSLAARFDQLEARVQFAEGMLRPGRSGGVPAIPPSLPEDARAPAAREL